MAFASGIFSRLYSWVSDRDGGIKIRADRMDAEFDGIKDALNEITAGTVQMIGPIKGYDGTVSAPGYGFYSDQNTGFYRIGADNFGAATGGVKAVEWDSSARTMFNKTVAFKKGADIASASALTPGSDGNYFDVTGTVTITSIANAAQAGTIILLQFDGALTLTHSSALVLPTAANITTAAGDHAEFVYESAAVWRCVSYTRASGAALVGATAASTTEVLTGSDASKMVTPDALAALWEKGGDVASSGTVSFGEGGYFHVTGTTTITDINFATPKDGRWAWVIFDGALTLTHNSTTLKLPGGANITTAAGDRALFVQDNSDNVICLAYIPATGYQPLDSDLSTLASLTATTDNFIQSKSSAWASRTPTQVTADLIAVVGDSGSGGTKGLVPAPSAGDAAAGKYLKADGTWTAPTAGITTDSQQPTSDTDNVTSPGFSGCKVVDICFAFTITDGTSRVMSIQGRVSGGTWRTITSFNTVADATSAIGGWCRIYNFNVATEKVFSYGTYTNTAVLDDSSASNSIETAAGSATGGGVGMVAQNEIWDEVRIVSSAGTPIEGSTADQRGRWYVAGYA